MTAALFSLIAAAAFGFVLFRVSLSAADRVRIYEKNLEIKILTGLSRRKVPFRIAVEKIEAFLSPRRFGWLGRYLGWLGVLLRRAARPDLTPRQLLAYQLLIFMAVSLTIGFLLGNPWMALGTGLLGAGLPLAWVRDLALQRESRISRELPNALEVLSLCGEAGLSLEQGLTQYLAQGVGKTHPLAEEFTKVLEQTRVGSSRKEALSAMGQRLQLTDVSLFATSVIHAEKFGTGMALTLRQLSATLRDKQSQRTEKAVQELPVKMLLPLLLFILPVTFLIIFGPVLLSFFN